MFDIGDEPVTIGRSEDSGVYIPHKSLSRAHARLECAGGHYFVVDLHSKNGTFVNGLPIDRKQLRHGDTITLGDVDLLFTSHISVGPSPWDTMLTPRSVRPLTRTPVAKLVRSESGSQTEREQMQAVTRLRILTEVGKLLPVSDDSDTLVSKVVDLILQILDVDYAAVLLQDESTAGLVTRVAKARNLTSTGVKVISRSIVDYAISRSAAVLFSDTMSDGRLLGAESVDLNAIRSAMCVPLKPREDIIGVLYVDNRHSANVFKDDDLELFAAFAGQASIALENARLYRRLEAETVHRMELVMEAKLSALSTLAAGLAHEMKNPIHLVVSFADLSVELAKELEQSLKRLPTSPDVSLVEEIRGLLHDLTANAEKIVQHGRRADAVVTGMIHHAERPRTSRSPTNIPELVSRSIQFARAGSRGGDLPIKVVEVIEPSLAPVDINAEDVGRVFINLVENAIDAMREKRLLRGESYHPELTVRVRSTGSQVEIGVRDNGIGIPKDLLDKVFEPFFTTKAPGKGTGLGLSLSHEIIVRGHRGGMKIDSRPGEFTEIIVSLPLSRSAAH
ncbi:MAG: FHA domain-containing protein [Polyangiaceae bacterium]|nr:FHA domain-containing protein [Polyangiaceae bacterium]